MILLSWRQAIGLGEWLSLFYLLAFTRQYFWVFNNNKLAWVFTILVSVLIWLFYLKFRDSSGEKTPTQFWLVVALPLLLFFLLRVPFPDISFDVLNYRLVQSERALYGAPFRPGDFFPVIFPLNPSPDLITGIFRHFLGYRLGTIVNYLTVVWIGLILNKLLRSLIPNSWIRSAAIMLVLLCEQIFFQINTYMVDLIALPLLLETVWLTSKYQSSNQKQRDLILVAALMGGALAIKLSNITAVIPLALWFAFEFFAANTRPLKKSLKTILIGTVVFLLPLLPHALYVYRDTGSPFFPLYNEIFSSVYWPEINVGDGRWGPKGWFETFTWPFLTIVHPKRLSELGLYSGRLSLCWIAALICLLVPRTPRHIRGVAFSVLSGLLLWSLSSGYIRYGLAFEVLGGILLIYLIVRLWKRFSTGQQAIRWATVALPLFLLTAQGSVALFYAFQTEWGGRLTLFQRPGDYLRESNYLLHDHNLSKFLPADKKPLIEDVDAWIVSSVKSSGAEILLRNGVPMIGVHNLEYFDMPKSRERFANTLRANSKKRLFTLALADESETAISNIRRRGFQVSEPVSMRIPFYSLNTVLSMVMFEVTTRTIELPQKPNNPVATVANNPLPDDAFNAEFSIREVPLKLSRGQKGNVSVVVKNASASIWPARGRDDGTLFVRVANAWFDNRDKLVNNMDGRANIPNDMWPGDSVVIQLPITAPSVQGEYVLEIDMVQEGVTFFKAKGSQVLRLKITVE